MSTRWKHFMLISASTGNQFSSVQRLSRVQLSLWPHGLQHARPPCPSPTPGVYSNSCPSSQWCHLTISSSVIPSPPVLNLSQHQGLFQWVSFRIRWPKYWSFSLTISSSNEHPGLISFRMDWLDPCSPRDSQEPSPTPQFKSINS